MDRGDDDTGNVMREFQSAFGGSSSSSVIKPKMGVNVHHLSQNLSPENNKRVCVPPSHPNHPPLSPYSRTMAARPTSQQIGSQKFNPGPSHSRSLSQPAFFSLDSLPPLSPLTYHKPSTSSLSDPMSRDVSMEDKVGTCDAVSYRVPVAIGNTNKPGVSENRNPRKGHRRSNSDTPLGFMEMIQSSPQLIPIGSHGVLDQTSGRDSSRVDKPIQLVKRESEWNGDCNNTAEGMGERQSEGEVVDDLFSAYMNLDNIDILNLSGAEDKDLDSRASGTKTSGAESSDNEVESCVNANPNGMKASNLSMNGREGLKRSAERDIAPAAWHRRSVSMDSFMENLQFNEESLKLPLGTQKGHHSPSNSMDGFNLESLNGEFNGAELKKIMGNEKLSEIALSDPKRAKRILANRQSAARSKERKMLYIAELEHKVQTLQSEATTLSTQLTILQRDFSGLTNQNNELKFRIQAMEQQAQLRDALNETLSDEVQRLKLAATELNGEMDLSNCMVQQLSINHQMFHPQHNIYQLQQQQQQHRPNQPQTQKQNCESD